MTTEWTDERYDGRADSEEQLRARAVRRLRKQADFRAHLLMYVLVNGFLVALWAMSGGAFFWPIFPILGWGIGIVANAWDVYRRDDDPSEERIRTEMDRLRKR